MTAPPAYFDECIDGTAAPLLRARGFIVFVPPEQGTLEAADDTQLDFATRIGCVIITHNRRDFRRLHASFRAAGRPHGGIIVLPQAPPITRLALRAAMLLRWIASQEYRSRYFQWNDVQQVLVQSTRRDWTSVLPGFSDEEIEHALGWR